VIMHMNILAVVRIPVVVYVLVVLFVFLLATTN